MATKDISDRQVVQASADSHAVRLAVRPMEFLAERTGQPEKVCYRAMERAYRHGLIEFGVSLETAWPTDRGKEVLAA